MVMPASLAARLRSVLESKRLGETLCAQAAREGVNVGIVRIFNTYGPKMDPYDGRVVSTFIRQALQGKNFTVNGDGKQTRSFCHVDDMVDGIIKYARSGAVRPVNLGNPVELQVLDLALKIAELFSAQPIIDFLEKVIDDPMQRKPDITLAQQLLDWSPNISLDKGLTSTFNWMKSNLEN
jgi:dTDP-glucose 4,6-dehydratase